tara:strand:+ start:608 stop:757 length:150 start_codon:yes stop_codon:yes gene_type:complete
MKKIKQEITKILKKHGNLQTNLKSENAQRQITEEIVAVVVNNIYGEHRD